MSLVASRERFLYKVLVDGRPGFGEYDDQGELVRAYDRYGGAINHTTVIKKRYCGSYNFRDNTKFERLINRFA